MVSSNRVAGECGSEKKIGNWMNYTEVTEVLFFTGVGKRPGELLSQATEVMSSVIEVPSTHEKGSINC